MPQFTVRKGTRRDANGFLVLVEELARFEHLEPPSEEGKRRLVADIFDRGRINLLVARAGRVLAGYALYFYTYSSFLAKPTLYLEDLFVLDRYRGEGVGRMLFAKCVDIAVAERCGRMEWSVLNWNRNAADFYEGLGAKRLDDWSVYRLDRAGLRKVASRTS